MSNQPNDPFEGNPNSPQSMAAGAPPKKSKGLVFWLVGCLGGAGVLMLVCCGGTFFVSQMGMNMLATQFQSQIENDPVMVENIGDIESFSMSFSSIVENAQSQEPGSPPELPFEVVGSKGSGTVFIQQGGGGGDSPVIRSARLVTSDGETFPLQIDAPEDPTLEFDAESFDVGETTEPATP